MLDDIRLPGAKPPAAGKDAAPAPTEPQDLRRGPQPSRRRTPNPTDTNRPGQDRHRQDHHCGLTPNDLGCDIPTELPFDRPPG
jgi:hypothetical protein